MNDARKLRELDGTLIHLTVRFKDAIDRNFHGTVIGYVNILPTSVSIDGWFFPLDQDVELDSYEVQTRYITRIGSGEPIHA